MNDAVNAFNGIIDEFAAWNRALSAEEIARLYKGYYDLYPLRFQVRSGSSPENLETRSFVGEDGTEDTYFLGHNSPLIASDNFTPTHRYVQYRAFLHSSLDRKTSPLLGSIGLYGSVAMEVDGNTDDFDEGDYGANTVREGTGQSGNPYLGLGRSRTGGFLTSGEYISRVMTNAPGSTAWDELEWTSAGEELDVENPAGLLGYYKGADTWLDSSGQGHHGSPSVGVSDTEIAKLGARSAVFDGVNGHVNDFGYGSKSVSSIEFWLNTAAPDTALMTFSVNPAVQSLTVENRLVMAHGFDPDNYPLIYVNGNRQSPRLLNGWNHVAVVWPLGTTIPDWIVGRVGASYFRGMLDDVAVFSTVRGPSAVMERFIRGARHIGGRLRFQVRASDDPTFEDVPFSGPGSETDRFYLSSGSSLGRSGRYFQYLALLDGPGGTTPGLTSVRVHYNAWSGSHTDDSAEDFYGGSLGDEWLNPMWYGQALRLPELWALAPPNTEANRFSSALLHVWHMDGNWEDPVGGGHGTPAGNPGFTADSKVGSQAGTFDGVAARVGLGNTSLGSLPFSFGLWFRSAAAGRRALASNLSGAQTRYFRLELNDNGFGGTIPGGVALIVSDGVTTRRLVSRRRYLNDNRWHHALVVRNANQILLYIDGVPEAVANVGAGFGVIDQTSIVLGYSAASGHFQGALDEAVLFAQALTPAEVGQLAGAGFATRTRPERVGMLRGARQDNLEPAIWDTLGWVPDGLYGNTVPGSDDAVGGQWSLDEESGPAFDSSINANHGTVAGSRNQPGKIGRAVYLNGNGGIEIDGVVGLEPSPQLAVSAWIKADETDGRIVFDKRNAAGTAGYALGLDQQGRPFFQANSIVAVAPLPLRAGAWQHLAGQITAADEVQIFVNGDIAASVNMSGAILHAGPAWIGRTDDDEDYAWRFKGYVDEVVVFNRALTAAEIEDHYRAGVVTLEFQAQTESPLPPSGFLGPDGTPDSAFHDWFGADLQGAMPLPLGRYFQYQATLATEDHRYGPTLSGARIGVSSYPSSAPHVDAVPDAAAYFPGRLTSFDHHAIAVERAGVEYQITGDQGASPTWYFWNAPENLWIAADGGYGYPGETSDLGHIQAGITNFYDQLYDKIGGYLRFRAFLHSEGDYQVQLRQVGFTASPGRLTLLFPNGEEVGPYALVVGTPYDITWESDGDVSDNLTIALYRDSGATFIRNLAAGVGNAGVYNTVITETVRSDYRIKIYDADQPATVYDWSDSDFEFVRDLRLTQPNGGERWYIGQTNTVKWDSWGIGDANLGDRVDLWFRNKPGDAWFPITGSADQPPNQVGNNQYLWLTPADNPAYVSETARMGVSTPFAPNPEVAPYGDISVEDFVMAGIVVTYPADGTGIQMGTVTNVLFNAAGAGGGGVRVELFDGANWDTLAVAATCVPGTNSFRTVLDAPNPTEQARIRITANDDPLVTGTSAPFVLADINIINPRGGEPADRERWRIGSDQTIRWTSGGAGDSVDIDYAADGVNWVSIHADYPNTNSTDVIITNYAPWKVTGPPSPDARLRIQSSTQEGLFAITEPFNLDGVQLVTPNGFETWEFIGENDVEWIFESTAGLVDMYITYNDGPTNTYETIQEGISGYAKFWRVMPDRLRRPSTRARIMLRVRGIPDEFDVSDNMFTIRGLSMTHPTNNAVYNLRTTEPFGLQWYSARTEDRTAELFYARDGVNFNEIIHFAGVPFIGNVDEDTSFNRHDWAIPGRLMPSYNGRVKVVAGDYEAVSQPFTMRGIRVTRPQAGDMLTIGSNEEVIWAHAGLADAAWSSNAISFNGMNGPFHYVGAGAGGSDIALIINNGFRWDINPGLDPTTNAVMRVSVYTPAQDTDVVMYSDPFTLRGLKVTSPDADSVWTLGDQRPIQFRAAGLGAGSQATIRYSHNGGQTFDTTRPIAQNLNVIDDLNTYSWNIEASPEWTRMPSTNAVIQVVAGIHQNRSQPFRMRGIKVTRPIATDIWAVSDLTNTIRWAEVDASGVYDIGFTRWENGVPVYSNVIATGVTGNSYDWTMTDDAIGRDVTITVSDGTLSGISERFEIVAEPSIRIVSPAPGDFWKVNDAYEVRWSRGGNMDNDFQVFYSAYPFNVTNLLAQGAFPLDDGMFSTLWSPIPNMVGPMRLHIVNQRDPDVSDTFENFEIAARFEIEPFVGDIYALEPNPVDWTTRGSISSGVDFYYTTDLLRDPKSWVKVNAVPFTGIAHNQPSTYLWTVPNVKSDTVWLRIQDANYTNRYAATRTGPYDDLGPFEVKYYQITWNVRDAATSNHLNNLSVSDSSGWSQSDLQSPVVHEYPYGTWDTAWFREYFSDKVVFQWRSRPSRSIDVYMAKSEIEPDFRVMANFAYNPNISVFNIQSWLERGGRIINTPQQNTIRIYDAAGVLIDTLVSSQQSEGVFWQTWDIREAEARLGRTFGNMEVFFARVEIIYSGVTYSSGLTFMLRQAADVGDIPVDYRVYADFNYQAAQTNFAIQSWIEDRGLIREDAESVAIEIFESSGAPVLPTLHQDTPLNGVFWLEWSLAGLGYSSLDMFFAKVTILLDGQSYSAGFTLQPRQTASEEIEQVIDAIGESSQNILGRLDEFSADAMLQFTNLFDSVEGVRSDLLESLGTNRLMLADALVALAGIDADLALIMPDITNMAARMPGIEDDLTAGLARILTRPPTIAFGSTNTILYRSRAGYANNTVNLNVEPAGFEATMTEIIPGIYQYTGLIADWGLGEFIVSCSDPNASDHAVVQVVRPGADELPLMMAAVSNNLENMRGEINALNAMMLDLATLDDMTNEIAVVLADVRAMRDILDDFDVDLSGLPSVEDMEALSNLVADISASLDDFDLDQLARGDELAALSNMVAGVQQAVDEIDLSDLASGEAMAALSNMVAGVQQAVDEIDLSALPSGDELMALSNLVADISASLDEFDLTDLAKGEDVAGVHAAVGDLQTALVDLDQALADKATTTQVTDLRQAVDDIMLDTTGLARTDDMAGLARTDDMAGLAGVQDVEAVHESVGRVEQSVHDLEVQVETEDIRRSIAEIERAMEGIDTGVDPSALARIETSLSTMATDESQASMAARLDSMAAQLSQAGASSDEAFKRASSARTEASRAAAAAEELRTEFERGNLAGMLNILAEIDRALSGAQSELQEIPGAVQLEPYFKALENMAATIGQMAQSQGFEQWLQGAAETIADPDIAEPETMRGLNRRMEEMQGEMRLLHRLMEDIVHEPIIEEILIGVD